MARHPHIEKIELHLVIGCADSRDLPTAFHDAVPRLKENYRQNGIHVDFERLSAAGSFITEQIKADIKSTVIKKLNSPFYINYLKRMEAQGKKPALTVFIHITSHGDVRLKDGITLAEHRKTYSASNLQVLDSDTNCGMLHATEVGAKLQELLLDRKPTLRFGMPGAEKRIKISTEADIEMLLDKAYGHKGIIAGDWIRSIPDLATHPLEMKHELRKESFASDTRFNDRDWIKITAGHINYCTNTYIRSEENHQHQDTFYDKLWESVQRAGVGSAESELRTAKQAPLVVLVHRIEAVNARETAIRNYFGRDTKFSAGQVFAIASTRIDDYSLPLDPYQIAALFYALDNLGIRPVLVMGKERHNIEGILGRLLRDPIAGFLLPELGAKIVPMTESGKRFAIDPVGSTGDVRCAFPVLRIANSKPVAMAPPQALRRQ